MESLGFGPTTPVDFDRCSWVKVKSSHLNAFYKVSNEEYDKVMLMDLEELQENSIENRDTAKAILDTFYQNECDGVKTEVKDVKWSSSGGRNELRLDLCCFPIGKQMVILRGDVEASTVVS
jgi:hypothetical protein